MKKGEAMIEITLRLSESLLCILRDANNPKEERLSLRVERGTSVGEILAMEKIPPLLVPMISVGEERGELATALERDETITLIGPLAGG